ncbi:MAG: hypothetical protein Kow0098_22030 [Ignavibacteriaceae bacterium]
MKFIRKIHVLINNFGFYPVKFFQALRGLPVYFKNLIKFGEQHRRMISELKIRNYMPYPADRYDRSGIIESHYFYQDLFIARKILNANPVKHVDIGSRIDGFVAIVAAFRKIEVIDIRPLIVNDPNIVFIRQDITDDSFDLRNYCDSVSCLHTLEHFGLGRYGDSPDPRGHIKGLERIFNILNTNGKLYLSVPIGLARIEFDAHRVFSIEYLLGLFEDMFKIDSFSFIDDNDLLHEDTELTAEAVKNNFGCDYGCGIFELTKL